LKVLWHGFLFLLAFFLLLAGRVLWSGFSDLKTARECAEQGLYDSAVHFYSKAGRAYLPIIGAHEPARTEMKALCEKMEEKEKSLMCFRHLRSAILATRWLLTPDKAMLEDANERIATLTEDSMPKEKHLELLRRDFSPNPFLALLAVVLFFVWIFFAIRAFYGGITKEGQILGKKMAKNLFVSLVFVVLWLIVLRFA
jgi:hypothetical protein